jgi:signal transduction histidine kinase
MGFDRHLSSGLQCQTRHSATGFQRNGARRPAWTGTGTHPDAWHSVRAAERTRIAQELHDTLLQGFYSVSMQLHTAVDQLPGDSSHRSRFGNIVKLMERVLDQGRLAVQGLRAPAEDGHSLGQAIAAVPEELALSPNVEFQVVVEGRQRELRTSLRDEVYRIAREAIVNAYRHSQAAKIETLVEYRAGEFRLSVRDDGCGIDIGLIEGGCGRHWGLQGMRERAERIGGRFRIFSRARLGPHVELSVPACAAYGQAL